MARENFNDLQVFVTVARERSFTRAAAQLGVSQSALSHTVRGLEERLGVRLLTRTTRSVSMTEAGERLYDTVAPRMQEIEAEVAAISEYRDRPAGTIRITTAEHAANTIVWPRLAAVRSAHRSAWRSWPARVTSPRTPRRRCQPTWPHTTASACACPPTAG